MTTRPAGTAAAVTAEIAETPQLPPQPPPQPAAGEDDQNQNSSLDDLPPLLAPDLPLAPAEEHIVHHSGEVIGSSAATMIPPRAEYGSLQRPLWPKHTVRSRTVGTIQKLWVETADRASALEVVEWLHRDDSMLKAMNTVNLSTGKYRDCLYIPRCVWSRVHTVTVRHVGGGEPVAVLTDIHVLVQQEDDAGVTHAAPQPAEEMECWLSLCRGLRYLHDWGLAHNHLTKELICERDTGGWCVKVDVQRWMQQPVLSVRLDATDVEELLPASWRAGEARTGTDEKIVEWCRKCRHRDPRHHPSILDLAQVLETQRAEHVRPPIQPVDAGAQQRTKRQSLMLAQDFPPADWMTSTALASKLKRQSSAEQVRPGLVKAVAVQLLLQLWIVHDVLRCSVRNVADIMVGLEGLATYRFKALRGDSQRRGDVTPAEKAADLDIAVQSLRELGPEPFIDAVKTCRTPLDALRYLLTRPSSDDVMAPYTRLLHHGIGPRPLQSSSGLAAPVDEGVDALAADMKAWTEMEYSNGSPDAIVAYRSAMQEHCMTTFLRPAMTFVKDEVMMPFIRDAHGVEASEGEWEVREELLTVAGATKICVAAMNKGVQRRLRLGTGVTVVKTIYFSTARRDVSMELQLRPLRKAIGVLEKSTHPCVVRLLAATRQPDSAHIILEVASFRSLAEIVPQLMKANGAVHSTVVADAARLLTGVAAQCLLALKYLHVVHRITLDGPSDLSHILIASDGCVKLTGFHMRTGNGKARVNTSQQDSLDGGDVQCLGTTLMKCLEDICRRFPNHASTEADEAKRFFHGMRGAKPSDTIEAFLEGAYLAGVYDKAIPWPITPELAEVFPNRAPPRTLREELEIWRGADVEGTTHLTELHRIRKQLKTLHLQRLQQAREAVLEVLKQYKVTQLSVLSAECRRSAHNEAESQWTLD